VAQTVALSSYVKTDPPERADALAKLREEFGLVGGGRGQGAGGGRGATQPAAAGGGAAAAGTAPAAPRPPVPPCPVEAASTAAAGAGRGGGGRGAAALAQLSPERRAEYDKRLAEIDAKWPAAGRAAVKDFVDHIDYMVKLIGIDHVGISSDFDGGGGVDGWNSAAESGNVTLELVRRGYTEEQIGKLWSGNLLRVWSQVITAAEASHLGRQ
jgi:membrane dipeptidase